MSAQPISALSISQSGSLAVHLDKPHGQAGLWLQGLIPPKAFSTHSTPFLLHPSVTFLRWKLLFKKKEKEKEKGATAVSGLQIQQAKYRARFLWEGLLPHWPVHSRSLIYIFTNLVPCTIRNETPPPQHNNVVQSPQPKAGRGWVRKKGEEETDSGEGLWGNWSHGFQINLFVASASIGKGKRRKSTESARHINPCQESRARLAHLLCLSEQPQDSLPAHGPPPPSSGPRLGVPVRAVLVSPRV